MDYKNINILLRKLKSCAPKILVIGDIMLDCYIHGNVSRISPEAPVAILNFEKENNVLGGAGNVVHNLVNLGTKAKLSTIIGDDFPGKKLENLISKLKLSQEFIFCSSNINTTKKTRFISKSTQLLRVDSDSKGYQKSDYLNLEDKLEGVLDKIDCIIISDYNKGACHTNLIKNIILKSNEKKIPTFIDPKGDNWEKYANATCVTPNKEEAEKELNVKLENDLDYENASKLIIERYNLKSCLITRGSEGMTYNTGENVLHQRVGKKDVFDVSGAGDLVIACIAACFSSGFTYRQSIELSSTLSSEVVKYVGTVPFSSKMFNSEDEK